MSINLRITIASILNSIQFPQVRADLRPASFRLRYTPAATQPPATTAIPADLDPADWRHVEGAYGAVPIYDPFMGFDPTFFGVGGKGGIIKRDHGRACLLQLYLQPNSSIRRNSALFPTTARIVDLRHAAAWHAVAWQFRCFCISAGLGLPCVTGSDACWACTPNTGPDDGKPTTQDCQTLLDGSKPTDPENLWTEGNAFGTCRCDISLHCLRVDLKVPLH